jgi:hypothetical protein
LRRVGWWDRRSVFQRDHRRSEAVHGHLEADSAGGPAPGAGYDTAAHANGDAADQGPRIFHGNTRASTEIIRKGKAGKPNEFGKMVKLQEAENQFVTDFYDQRPSDSELLILAIEIHHGLFDFALELDRSRYISPRSTNGQNQKKYHIASNQEQNTPNDKQKNTRRCVVDAA